MDSRPSLSDAFVHSARLTEILRAMTDAQDLEALKRTVQELQEIFDYMQQGTQSTDMVLAQFCSSESGRVLGLSEFVLLLKYRILAADGLIAIRAGGRLLTPEDAVRERFTLLGKTTFPVVRDPATGELMLRD